MIAGRVAMSKKTIDNLRQRADRGLPLFDRRDRCHDNHDDDNFLMDVRCGNGRTVSMIPVAGQGAQPERHKRRRSLKELALAQDPRHRQREAGRKRFHRAIARGDPLQTFPRWVVMVPQGATFEVQALGYRDAVRVAKNYLSVSQGLPRGTTVCSLFFLRS